MIRKQLYLLYIIICVLSLLSCADNTHEEALCEAETLMNAEQYEEAYALLDSIDDSQFHPGSRQQARYALLYTKAQYKNYIDSDNDSLITLAVDYAEAHGDKTDKFYAYLYQGIVRYLFNDYSKASVSLIRSLANADDVEDHYSKGQMFAYLAMVNGALHCKEEDYYASLSYHEFIDGDLYSYAISSMARLAVAKIHKNEYDSARYWIDTCLNAASSIDNSFIVRDALAIKAKYAVLVDSFLLAAQLFQELENDPEYELTPYDYHYLALIHANNNEKDSAYYYLSRSNDILGPSIEERTSYWSKSIDVSRLFSDPSDVIQKQDSFIYYQDKMLEQSITNSVTASSREYANWQFQKIKAINQQMQILLSSLIACILFLFIAFYFYIKRKKLQIQLQAEKINRMKLTIKQQEKEVSDNLQLLKASDFVANLKDSITKQGIPHVDWSYLHVQFCEKLPMFETSLRELSSLSDTEWRVCMLIKLGFTPGQIAVLISKSAEGVSSIRRRLYYKVFQKKGKAADWDKFIEKL